MFWEHGCSSDGSYLCRISVPSLCWSRHSFFDCWDQFSISSLFPSQHWVKYNNSIQRSKGAHLSSPTKQLCLYKAAAIYFSSLDGHVGCVRGVGQSTVHVIQVLWRVQPAFSKMVGLILMGWFGWVRVPWSSPLVSDFWGCSLMIAGRRVVLTWVLAFYTGAQGEKCKAVSSV